MISQGEVPLSERTAWRGVGLAVLLVFFAVVQWWQVADVRAHRVEVTADVVTIQRGYEVDRARLEFPAPDGGSTSAWMDVSPATKVNEGDLIEVTYDPGSPDTPRRGWGIDYTTPIVVSLLAVAAVPASAYGVRVAARERPRSYRNGQWVRTPRPRRPGNPVKRKKR